jgi:hypothetical protein
MEFNLTTRNHILNIFNREHGWLTTPFIATVLQAELGIRAPLRNAVTQLDIFLTDLPEVEEAGGKYRLKVIAKRAECEL